MKSRHTKLMFCSLYVSVLWALDIEGFRKGSERFKTYKDVQKAVLPAASKVDTVSKTREMARINPEERASMAQMLVKCCNGTQSDSAPYYSGNN